MEQVLIREYVRLQVAHVDSIVGDGLLRAGTNWCAFRVYYFILFYFFLCCFIFCRFFHEARTMRVQDYAIKLLLRLVATHNQLMSRCPELLNDIMSRVVEGDYSSSSSSSSSSSYVVFHCLFLFHRRVCVISQRVTGY